MRARHLPALAVSLSALALADDPPDAALDAATDEPDPIGLHSMVAATGDDEGVACGSTAIVTR